MAKNSEKRYGIIDHANKLGDRNRVNPNRAAQCRLMHRRPTEATKPADGAGRVREEGKANA
ncbi:MAG: hypothetical protein R3288_08355 [Woeseiaceae bacterium]|nr:hypothetical protein [Woeseiaceae bacterium]